VENIILFFERKYIVASLLSAVYAHGVTHP